MAERVVQVYPIEQDTPLYTWWVTKGRPHAAYLLLNLDNGALKLVDGNDPDTHHKPGMSPWRRWRVPAVTIEGAEVLLYDVAPYAQRVLDGSAMERNIDGSWTTVWPGTDGITAYREIGPLCEGAACRRVAAVYR